MLDEAKWKQSETISITLYSRLVLSNANLNCL